MINDLATLGEKLVEHDRLALRANEARTNANLRVSKVNEAIYAAAAVTVTDRRVIDRLEKVANQAQSQADALHRRVVTAEAEIIEGIQVLLAQALRREGETRQQLAAMRSGLDDLGKRLGTTNEILTSQGEQLNTVGGQLTSTVKYVITSMNPVQKVLRLNTDAVREVVESVRGLEQRRAGATQASPLPFGRPSTRQLPADAIDNAVKDALQPSVEQAAGLPEKLIAVMFASNPEGHEKVSLDHEMHDIQEQLAASRHGRLVQFELCPATRVTDLFDRLNRFAPRLVHFSGHGTAEGIVLSTPNNLPKPVAPGDLIGVIHSTLEVSPVILFNICDSAQFAEQAAQSAEVAIGMAGPISDAAARAFTVRFYGGIAAGHSVQTAYAQAVQGLRAAGHPDAGLPQMFFRPDVDPSQVWLVRPSS
ncbi:CHAT domain-containing protein [Actinoplanes sp. NPDC089786]|uniref:CHAT domain-containing protein n=1 Tax=Actinoplanes sp. NPDC089786 TaxID=3155185 RepID=UPI003447DC9D